MESVFHFVSENSVLLLNGSFVQSASAVRYKFREPLFVTVLPLDAMYLPYTIEILGGKAVTNENLAICCDMGDGHYYIELLRRSAYVYSPEAVATAAESAQSAGLPAKLLEFVRDGNYSAARALLTTELSDSVSDGALSDFFEGVIKVRENNFTQQKGYLLIKNDGTAARCDIIMKNGLIENIVL